MAALLSSIKLLANPRVGQWLATSLLFAGAVLVSAIPNITTDWHVFIAFLLGHLIFVADSIKTKHYPYIALNGSFLLLDMYAIWIRIVG